jgi:hypothetical protein
MARIWVSALITTVMSLLVDWPPALAGPLTPGDIIISNSTSGFQDIFEYTPGGTLVQRIPIAPAGDGRDLVVDGNGQIQLYNGTFSPTLTQYNQATTSFGSQSFAGWSTVNNITYGGIATIGRYVFVTDMQTSGDGSPSGVVRFDLGGGPTVRFATDLNPIDLNVGLDGRLYVLNEDGVSAGGNRIEVFDPTSMDYIREIILPNEQRAIAVDANGDIYGAERDPSGMINHFDSDGLLLKSIAGFGGESDIDINSDGGLVVASHGGELLVTTTQLDSAFIFGTRPSDGMNFAAWVPSAVPEPSSLGLLGIGLALALSGRLRRR